ncbi:MAG: GTP-binding signal recognition particle SRP54 G-domain [Limisphaerales bacterium]|nr:MAG: GTP-binding signal recognition particle SRP54 G-domain [Limisphaerales bacterium]KAG0506963.1 MAG: GTP-binding signal recognition particle SRP54 G-domain [Limisphaerales bacterium]TXT47213.1 MAG: GTP-binding signal recognition particle SRP54 G-domain [Limisphaerales bacterium]
MNTDGMPDLKHPENTKLLLKEETHQILGCAFEVLNEVGHGLHEKIYENALVVEFKLRGIASDQQRRYPVLYKGVQVGEYVPDLIAFDAVIVDTKTIDRITDHERGKMINYLRKAKLRVGLILNFKHARLEWERIVV